MSELAYTSRCQIFKSMFVFLKSAGGICMHFKNVVMFAPRDVNFSSSHSFNLSRDVHTLQDVNFSIAC